MATPLLPHSPGLLDLAGVSGYSQRQPTKTVVWQVVQKHWQDYRAETARRHDGRNLPAFVDAAAKKFMGCGMHSSGFARVRCKSCHDDLLVPFSCKQRGICSSCDGRRMAELSIHLVDHIIARVACRQWVITYPYWLRFRLAFDANLMSGVLSVWVKTVENWYRKQARDEHGVADGRCASIGVVQRFGDAIVLNPHIHSVFCEGVWFSPDGDDNPTFLQLRGPTDAEVQRIVMDARRRTLRWLVRRGVLQPGEDFDDNEDAITEDEPVRAWCTKAAVLDRIAIGKYVGQLVARLRDGPVEAKKMGRRCAMADGFNLHANVRVGPLARDSLERLCRYILRPALCNARLERLPDGRVVAKLKRRWSDGTWAKVFEPLDFLSKVTAIIPLPGRNLLRYFGQFAPQGRWRDKVVITPRKRKPPSCAEQTLQEQHKRMSWAELLRRTFLIDVLQCPCGGRRELISVIQDDKTKVRILDHVGINSTPPRFAAARAPPQEQWLDDSWD